MSSSSPLLSLEGLQVDFQTRRGLLKAVNQVKFAIRQEEVYGIVGESGSGKSVTALSILGLLPINARIRSGRILFEGRDLLSLGDREMRSIRGQEISMIFQDPQTSFDPVFPIADQIDEAIRIHQNLSLQDREAHVVNLLRSVGIPEPEVRKDQYPHQFSGGMKQRMMSAMALSNRPKLIIADEPTTSLDVTIQAQIMDLFTDLKRDFGVSILLITHDMGLISEICDRVSVMYAGYILETADVFSLFQNPRHPYTRALMESIPRLDANPEELESIPGRVSNPLELSPFCTFQPRCKFAKDICLQGIPDLLDIAEGRQAACYLVQQGEL